MGDDPKGTLDPGKQVTTPDAGKNVTPEQVQKMISDSLAANNATLLQSITSTFEPVVRTVNGLAAEKRRADPKPEPKGSDKQEPSNEEVSTLRDEVKTLREERQKDKKKLALKDALDAHGETIAGRNHLERLIGTELDFDSTGNVVAVVDGKHVPLKDRVKSYADDPQWQKPSGTNGTGKPDGNKQTHTADPKKIQVKRNDYEAKARYVKEIAAGQVEFVE